MENVVAFNNELSSLYESKPPISKAKMAAITRAAMKAIKFYKHVVQSVEKFILKCKPEYKVPGLYVIDSIVRQSRHQFGTEKDVFAPRFARNMRQTFANLFHCAPDDKSRIIRVLNLWQKNNVFAPEVIQPLFDLADPNNPIYQQTGDNTQDNNMSSISNGLNLSAQDTSNLTDESHFHSQQSDMMMGHQTGNSLDQNTIRQLQQLQQILIRQTNNDDNPPTTTGGIVTSQSDSIKFNKKVLDYDYGDDEEDEKTNSPHTITNILDSKNLTQLLKDPNVLRQLQTLQKFKEQEEKQSRMKDINKSQDISYDKHMQGLFKGPGGNIMNETLINIPDKSPNIIVTDAPVIEVINLEDGNDSRSTSPDRDRYKRSRRSSRSKSRDRGGRSDRDRDRDRSRRGGRSRSRSRSSRSPPPSSSRSNRRRSSREKDRNNKEKEREKEYERERRRKGLPDIKKEHLTVCSNTLWVGHLSKLVHQEELSDTFGKYGDIISIDMIYPRGCAFIVMNRRQDAFKAMQNLKNHKLQGRVITISWAAGKGVKSKEWKDYWDLDLGVSYIPWSKLNENTDLEALEEGGMFDEDSMPNWMKDRMNQKKSDNREQNNQNILGTEGVPVDTSQPPPTAGAMMPGVSLIPPYSAMGPVPRLMPPPLGVPMTGSMVPGLPMPANIVPGMPPPHMMMPPPTGMVSGFAPMPTPLDKPITSSGVPSSEPQTTSVPPSFLGANVGGIHLAPHMAQQQPPFGGPGIPPQFPPPLTDQSNTVSSNVNQGEDHMDIEMEDENPSIPNKLLGNSSGPSVQFSQPPPLFPTFSSELLSMSNRNNNQTNDRDLRNANDNDDRNDMEFERGSSRNREGSREKSVEFGKRDREQNRWSSERSLTGGDRDAQTRVRDRNNMDREKTNNTRTDFNQQEQQGRSIPPIWQNSGQNFTVPLFNDNQQRGNPMEMNISALDVNNPQFQRLHFDMQRNNEFIGDDRRGGMLSSQQQPQRDFFQNINNLNNIPSLVNNLGNRFGPAPAMNRGGGSNMSIRPPFTPPRLGPMFMRGPIRPGPPGFNFNDRPAFERDESRGGGRTRNNDNRRSGGRSNWRDDDNNRRSNVSGSGSGNRFQGRDRDNDRQNRDKNDNDGGRGRRDRGKDSGSRTDRDKNHNRGGGRSDRDRSSERDGRKTDGRKSETESMSQNDTNDNKPYRNNSPIRPSEDTEEDWDKELSDHNVDHSSREEINTQNNNENNNENLESWDSGDDENQFDNNNPNLNSNNDNEQLDDYDGNGYDDDNDHVNREYNRSRSRNLNNTADDDMQEFLNSSTEESSVFNRDNTKMNNSNVTDENENENQQDIAGELSSSFSNDNNSNNNQVIENSS